MRMLIYFRNLWSCTAFRGVRRTRLWGAVVALVLVLGTARAETVVAYGITEPVQDITLGAPVAGIVAERQFEEGAFVKRGEIIVELDKKLEELETKRRALVLVPLKSELEGDRHLYETTGSVSKQELDKKELEYNIAVVEHELAREQLQKRMIAAPFDGFIAEIYLEVGEACQAQQPLARLVDTRRCLLVSNLEAATGHFLQVGQDVDLEVEAGGRSVHLKGTVSFVSPVVDPASGLLRVKAVFENSAGIRPGVAGKMFFERSAHVN